MCSVSLKKLEEIGQMEEWWVWKKSTADEQCLKVIFLKN